LADSAIKKARSERAFAFAIKLSIEITAISLGDDLLRIFRQRTRLRQQIKTF
jgi:hypothetical protein